MRFHVGLTDKSNEPDLSGRIGQFKPVTMNIGKFAIDRREVPVEEALKPEI